MIDPFNLTYFEKGLLIGLVLGVLLGICFVFISNGIIQSVKDTRRAELDIDDERLNANAV